MDIHESLRQLCNLMKKQINADLEKDNLTFSQTTILMFIIMNKDKKINQRIIEQEFNLSNPTVTGILNRLEKKDFIKRINDISDKRRKNIIPNKKAYEFIKTLEIKKQQMEENMLKDISKDEKDILFNILEKINKNLKEKIK